jgi:hypothetical protein
MTTRFFIICLLAITALSSCQSGEQQSQTEAANQDTVQTVQAFFPDTLPFDVSGAISVADMKQQLQGKDSLMVKVSAEITETCTRMGCWMDIKDESGKAIKVRMKDHAFFVPVDGCEGKKCVIEGLAFRTTFTEEERLHYAEESDMSAEEIAAIKGPEDVITITAYKVMIENPPVEEHNEHDGHDHEGHDHDHEGHEHHDHEHEGEAK